jgi:hypothetical protein
VQIERQGLKNVEIELFQQKAKPIEWQPIFSPVKICQRKRCDQ